MTTRPIALVVHGGTPVPDAVVDALSRHVATAAGVPSVSVRSHWTSAPAAAPVGLAAAIDAGPEALVVVCHVDHDAHHVDPAAVTAALVARGGLVVGQCDGDAAARCGPVGAEAFLDALANIAAGAAWWPTRPCRAWGVERSVFGTLGGFDTAISGIVAVDDLARRALARGLAVQFVDVAPDAGATAGADSAAAFAGLRDTIVSASLHGTAEQRGRHTALAVARGIAASWSGAAVDPGTLRFGGDWARQRSIDRWFSLPGVRRGDGLWPHDVTTTVLPLLAIDDALRILASRPMPRPVLPRHGVTRDDDVPTRHGDTRASATAVTVVSSGSGDVPLPSASVVVVNWNGREHLEPLFASLRASDYPAGRLELVCVDNGSTDGSVDLLRAQFPDVRVVTLPENAGFTGGNVAGVAAATGEVLVFLNNDMRVEPDAVRRLVAAIDDAHPCTGACVLSWDGQRIDFLRGTASWEARGFQEHYGDPRDTLPTIDTDTTFFPNGGAFAITRDAYTRAGGFDPAYFAYYDDLDLGWGVRVSGGHIRVVRDAIVYHRHGATSAAQPRGQKRFLMDRNAVWTMVKRYGDAALARALAPALLLAVRRFVGDCALVAPRTADGIPESVTLKRAPLELLAALGEAVAGFATIVETRRRLAPQRRVADRHVLSRMGRALDALQSRTEYAGVHAHLVDLFGLAEALHARSRVLLLTHEPLRSQMSGPGVRVLELGRALARAGAAVTIASPFESDLRDPTVTIARHAGTDLAVRDLAAMHDVAVVQGFALEQFPTLTWMPIVLVVDLYCPFTIENLEMRSTAIGSAPDEQRAEQFAREAADALRAQQRQLAVGDFFICASERQRDFWIGALQAAGRLTLDTYRADPSLRHMIDVVPFGLPDAPPPPKQRRVIKGVFPGIRDTDTVLLWAGSMLDWQDPQTLIRAVARLSQTRDDVKLVFMGTRHPNPAVPQMRVVGESQALADALGATSRCVFFNEWVPYPERHEWLLEADIGVSTHGDHLETHFSFRTRMLDYLWGGLPMVATRGDVFAELIERDGLGLTVAPGDETALAQALARMIDDGSLRARCAEAAKQTATTMTWTRVVAPLAAFCARPRQAQTARQPPTRSDAAWGGSSPCRSG